MLDYGGYSNINKKREIIDDLNARRVAKDGLIKTRSGLGLDVEKLLDIFVLLIFDYCFTRSELKLFLELLETHIDDRRIK